MASILLIEDSELVQFQVAEALAPKHRVVCAGTGKDAQERLAKDSFDLILLDVMLPDADGFQLFLKFKSNDRIKDVPIIFLTGKSSVGDRVAGLSLGAEDYVVKPFEPLEFRARVEMRLSKTLERRQSSEVLNKGDLRLNTAFRKAYVISNGTETELDLAPIEFKLLYYFMSHAEHVLTRDQVLGAVWGNSVHVLDRTVDKHISSLRQKLGERSHYIKTIPGEGYRFSPALPASAKSAA